VESGVVTAAKGGGGVKRARRHAAVGGAILRPDQLEGWPAPEDNPDWFGDPVAERTLLGAFRSGRIHHAWLICGPKGIGKATLAYRFARFVLAHPDPSAPEVAAAADLSVSPEHPAFRKVAARAHPNLLVLQRAYNDDRKRFYTELTVDEIRRSVSFFGSTAGEPGWRVAIVDPADDMNLNAANALLKTLEEPPARSLFLIVCHAPGRLLPTIRSRCRRLNIRPWAPEAIKRALAGGLGDAASLDASELQLATELAEGSLRRALHLVEGGGTEIYRELAQILETAPDVDVEAVHALATRVAARDADEAFDSFLDAVCAWLDRRVRGEEEPDIVVRLSPAVRRTPLESWAQVWENVRRSSTLADALNLDRKQAVLSILMTLARATRM
jgi:DNA polymerase-3 subunit delta'